MKTLKKTAACRAHGALVAALCLGLAACGGTETATTTTAGPTFTVKGSMSRTMGAAAPTWWQRALAWLAPSAAHAQAMTAGSPTRMVLRIHSLQITENADCSGPYTTVQRFDPPRDVDLATNPTLFEGSPAAGTYRCLIFEADDILTVRPDAAAAAAFPGRCMAGTDHATDLYREPDTDFRRPDGTTITATGTRAAPGRQRVFFFASTNPTAANSRPGGPSPTQTVPLASPLVVPAQTTFYLDATNGLLGDEEDGVSYCVVEDAVMGFR